MINVCIVGRFLVRNTCPNSIAGRAKMTDDTFSCSSVLTSLPGLPDSLCMFSQLGCPTKGKWG